MTNLCVQAAIAAVVAGIASMAAAENIVFPDDAGHVDITKAPYNAVNDGKTDCTAAIQKALYDWAGKDAIIYFPDGVYLVSDTLSYTGRCTRNMLQGQSQARSVIKLKDRCAGFTDPSRPRPVINTGHFPPQRFRNAIRNLTVDTGKGNHGAIGIQFNASNQGQMNTVTIRSGDGSGVIGLDMGYTGDVGPLTVKSLTVEGFDVGLYTAHATAAQTLEFVTLRNQRVCGWVNDGQAVAMRGLRTEGGVTGFWNKRGSSMVTLVDAQMTGTNASALPAIRNEGGLYARNVKTSGFARAIDGHMGTGRGVDGPEANEFVSHKVLKLFGAPDKAMSLPIEETPQIPWDDPKDWVSVAKFAPKDLVDAKDSAGRPVKVLDWTAAVQAAIDSGATTVYFPRNNDTGKPYEVLGTVHIRGKVRRIFGMEGGFGPISKPVFQLDDGEAPAVIVERFDWMYCPTILRASSTTRALVVGGLTAYIDVGPGGRVFAEDVISHFRMAKGATMWMRGWNTEYTSEDRHGHIWPEAKERGWDIKTHPGNLNDGGTLWVLGFKSEGDSTLLTTINGGKSEVLGGLVYANKNYNPDKRAFVVNDASLTLSVAESVIRDQPMNMVEETRSGETRLFKRGMASRTFVLFSAYGSGEEPSQPASRPAPPAGNGQGLKGEYFDASGASRQTRIEPVDADFAKTPPFEGAKDFTARWRGVLVPRTDGTHGFSLEAPNMRLTIDGEIVVDAWRNGARYRSGSLAMQAGRKYDVLIEYRSGGKPGLCRVNWAEPGQKAAPIPATQLHPPAADLPEVRLTASASSMGEKGGKVTVTAARTGDASAELAVRLLPRTDFLMSMVMRHDARGSAIEGDDYAAVPAVVVIPAGKAAASFELAAIDDARPEPEKTIVLELAPSTAYNVGGEPATVKLLDDDMPPPGSGTGLAAEYFARIDFSDSKAKRTDAGIKFDWDKDAPVAGLDAKKGYAIRWSGQLVPLFSETYTIKAPMTTYGALTVTLDGKPIIEVKNVGTQPKGRFGEPGSGVKHAQVTLEAGRKYDITVEFVCLNSYGSFVRLLWSSDSQFEQVIPASQLYPKE
jgi:hypothetical protein